MDKLKTELYGGFPFDLDDWRWELDAHRAAISGLAAGLQKGDLGAVILSGLELTLTSLGGVLAISAGWVSWGGELFYFPGGPGVGSLPPTMHFLTRDISMDPAGMEVFQDGTSQNAYERRRVKLVATGVDYSLGVDPENYVSIGRASRLRDQVWSGNWLSITAFTSDFDSPAGIWYRKEPGGIIRFRGSVRYTGATGAPDGSGAAFNMPVGLRPASLIRVPLVLVPVAGTGSVVIAAITNSGDVGVIGLPSLISGASYDLSSITYPIA